MKKIISCILALLFILSLVACNTGNSWTVRDVIDASAAQQRWLKRPNSTIMINPSAIEDNAAFSKNENNLGIEVGVLDSSGNVVVTLEDVCMILEANGSNGYGGEEVWTAYFEGEGQNVFGHSKLADNTSSGTSLSGTVPADKSTAMTIQSSAGIPAITNDNYYMVISVSNLYFPEGKNSIRIDYNLKDPSITAKTSTEITEPGNYLVSLRDIIMKQDNYSTEKYANTLINPSIHISQGIGLTVTKWCIIKVTEGLNLATKAASRVWYPYMISTSQEYDFGSVIAVDDMISGTNAISRSITAQSSGTIGLAGYLNGGTASLEQKGSVLRITGSDFDYSVSLSKFSGIMFYETLEDLLAKQNGTEEQTTESRYWATAGSSVLANDNYTIGIAASSKASDNTSDAAKTAALSATVRRTMDGIEEWWNEYIAANDVSGYITRHP